MNRFGAAPVQSRGAVMPTLLASSTCVRPARLRITARSNISMPPEPPERVLLAGVPRTETGGASRACLSRLMGQELGQRWKRLPDKWVLERSWTVLILCGLFNDMQLHFSTGDVENVRVFPLDRNFR